MEQQAKKRFIIGTIYTGLIVLIWYFSFRIIFSVLLPFVIGLAVAVASQRPAAAISGRLSFKTEKISAVTAAAICILICIVALALVYGVFCILRFALGSGERLTVEVINFFKDVRERIFVFFSALAPDVSDHLSNALGGWVESLGSNVAEYLTGIAAKITTFVPKLLFNFLVTVVSSCYIAKDFKILKSFFSRLFGSQSYKKAVRIKNIITQSIFKIIRGYLLLLLVTFLELSVAFFILRIKYAFLIATVISIVDLLPVLGVGTVLLPWGITEIFFGNRVLGFSLLGIYLVVMVVRNFLEPKIIGEQTGINPLFTLIAMVLGLKIAGAGGLIVFPLVLITVVKYYKEEISEERQLKIDLS